jgi:uncharacterized C2H2 Zn-finger protein
MAEYKCNICNKVFKRNPDLTRHLNKKKPCNLKIKLPNNCKCPLCLKTYSTKGSLRRHMRYTCNVSRDNAKTPTQTLIHSVKIASNKKISAIHCKYCDKKFSRGDNLNRHLNKYCKIKKDIVIEKEQIFQKLLENATNEIRNEMTNKINQLKYNHQVTNNNITNITNNNNNNNNNNITTNINIQLVAYDKEDKNLLKNTELFKILGKGFKSVPELIKAIHFNEEHTILLV